MQADEHHLLTFFKYMNQIKNFLTNKDTEAWVWMAINTFLILLLDHLLALDIDNVWLAMIIAALNVLTKFLNVKYIKP